MNSVTKETLIPIGLVVSIALLAFNAGKSSNNLENLDNRVHAIEIDRDEGKRDYKNFQVEVIARLSRIEEALKRKKGD